MSYAARVAGLADSLTRQAPAAMLGRVYHRDNLSRVPMANLRPGTPLTAPPVLTKVTSAFNVVHVSAERIDVRPQW